MEGVIALIVRTTYVLLVRRTYVVVVVRVVTTVRDVTIDLAFVLLARLVADGRTVVVVISTRVDA
jgi:hypothetical protein